MENRFDKRLFPTIRNRLKAHSEPYEAGAWEIFLKKKKRRRRALVYWCSAAAILLLLSFSAFLFTSRHTYRPFQTGFEEKPQITNNQERDESILTPDSIAGNQYHDTRREHQELQSDTKEGSGVSRNSQSPDDRGSNIPELPRSNNDVAAFISESADTSGYTRDNTPLPAGHGNDQPMISENGHQGDSISRDDMPEIATAEYTENSGVNLKADSTDQSNHELALNHKDKEKRNTRKPVLTLGVALGSGYGETEKIATGTNGLIREAGIIADLKFSRRLSLSSGLFFANQTIKSEEDLPLQLSGTLSNTQSITTNMANVSVPVNLKYTLPTRKDNIFIAAGISSFLRLSADSETERTLEREITVIREVNGMELLTTEIETITTKSSNQDNRTSFIPAGMINISAGLSNRLSNQLQLDIAPFYKYPLRDWPGEDARFGIIGLDLRLLFQKKTPR